MGIFGMPTTKTLSMRLGNSPGNQGNREGRRVGRRDLIYAKVELTIPPGYHVEDDTWLYPLVVEM